MHEKSPGLELQTGSSAEAAMMMMMMYSSINTNMNVFDTGLNKELHFFYNQQFYCLINNGFTWVR